MSQEDVITEVQDSLSKLQTAKRWQKMLRNNAEYLAGNANEPILSADLIEQLLTIMNSRPAYGMKEFAEHCRSFTTQVKAEFSRLVARWLS